MNTLEVNTAMEEHKEDKQEVITAKDVQELYDPEPEFLRAKTLTLEEAVELGYEAANQWDSSLKGDESKVSTTGEGTTETKVEEEPRKDAPEVGPEDKTDTVEKPPKDISSSADSEIPQSEPARTRPDHILESLEPIAPSEQREPKPRGRGRGRGKGRGKGRVAKKKEDDEEGEDDEDETGHAAGLDEVSTKPKGRKSSTAKAAASAEPSGPSASSAKTSKRKVSKVQDTAEIVKTSKPKSKPKGDKAKKTGEAKKVKGDKKDKKVEGGGKKTAGDQEGAKTEDEKKALASRKSSAYHVAKRLAQKEGKSEKEALELAKLVPWSKPAWMRTIWIYDDAYLSYRLIDVFWYRYVLGFYACKSCKRVQNPAKAKAYKNTKWPFGYLWLQLSVDVAVRPLLRGVDWSLRSSVLLGAACKAMHFYPLLLAALRLSLTGLMDHSSVHMAANKVLLFYQFIQFSVLMLYKSSQLAFR